MGILIFALVLTCYWPALFGGMLWDDAAHVTRTELASFGGLIRIWTDVQATQQYYPVLHSVFWLEHRIWGDAVLGYHLANILQHATACCLLALILRRLWQNDTGSNSVRPAFAWLPALLFAVHPVCVESVAWISEQKNTLSLVFYLLAALSYLEFDLRRKLSSYFCALIFFLLALGTKSVTATLPAALLVILWWKNARLLWRRDVLPLLPWFASALAAGLVTIWVERKFIGAEGVVFALSFDQRLLLAGRIIWFYLGKLLWPTELIFIYPHWDPAAMALGWWGYLVATIGVTAGLCYLSRRSRGPLAAWLLFIGTLFPALGFFNVYPFIFSYVADHFQYSASLAIITGAAAGIAVLYERVSGMLRAGVGFLCIALVGSLAVLCRLQSHSYADSETLYRDTLEKNPSCWMACNNLASELVKTPDRAPEALELYEKALSIKPDYAEAHNNLANELVKLPGRMPEALSHFEKALQIEPRFGEARVNLANALASIPGRMSEALAQYQAVLRDKPMYAEAHYCFANALASIPQRTTEAVAEYEQALRLRPDFVEAHDNLASLLATMPDRMQEALAHSNEALRLRPNLALSHFNHAVILSSIAGHESEAIFHYTKALQIRPGYTAAYNNLAIIFAKAGDLDKARGYWEKALAVDPSCEDARNNLLLLERRKTR